MWNNQFLSSAKISGRDCTILHIQVPYKKHEIKTGICDTYPSTSLVFLGIFKLSATGIERESDAYDEMRDRKKKYLQKKERKHKLQIIWKF